MKIEPAGLAHYNVPEHDWEGLQLYFEQGVPPGGFLLAVLENNLKEACARADAINQRHIWDIMNWLYNVVPMGSYGSKESVAKWLAYHADLRKEKQHGRDTGTDDSGGSGAVGHGGGQGPSYEPTPEQVDSPLFDNAADATDVARSEDD